jgi:hypothetical protein
VDGGAPQRITSDPTAETRPSWSRDGRWIYFSSDRSGRPEVYRVPAEGGPAQQVTTTGAAEGIEGPDGRVYFIRSGQPGVWMIPPEGGREREIPELRELGRTRQWGITNEGLYFLVPGQHLPAVRFFRFATRTVVSLLNVPPNVFWATSGLAISQDGRLLAQTRIDHDANDIMLVEGLR